jgi:hypothetical protein
MAGARSFFILDAAHGNAKEKRAFSRVIQKMPWS